MIIRKIQLRNQQSCPNFYYPLNIFLTSLVLKGYKILTKLGIEIINKIFEKQKHRIHMQIDSLPKLFAKFRHYINDGLPLVRHRGLNSFGIWYWIYVIIHYHYMHNVIDLSINWFEWLQLETIHKNPLWSENIWVHMELSSPCNMWLISLTLQP